MSLELRIDGGIALIDGTFHETSIGISSAPDGTIATLGASAPARSRIDASGLMVLPGIVDIHGDAFERQMMPRPGVDFPVDVALLDSDRQVVANGITTVFHGVTWSWEPGLRGADNARSILDAIDRLRPALAADTRFHLRHETYNLDAEPDVTAWLKSRRIGMLAFNDHLTATVSAPDRANKLATMSRRSGLSVAEFEQLLAQTQRRQNEVPASIARLAEAALASGVPMLSHDDTSPAQRQSYRALGCRLSEFPINMETAEDAVRGGDDIVFGAPNVVRGGSHIGWTRAADMVERGLCSILASDYYYPAQLLAAWRLAEDGVASLAQAWRLVSEAPALAAGLPDRGRLDEGMRADIILVDAADPRRPRVVATLVAGRIVHLTDGRRIVPAH